MPARVCTCAWLCLMLLVFTGSAAADKIYKWTDDQGNVQYSDQPRPGAQEMEISTEPAGITPVPAGAPRAGRPSEANQPYQSLIIAAPENGAELGDPEGRVNVSVVVAPSLQTDQGHTILLLLDGRPLQPAYAAGDIVLENVERGEHTMQAQVVDGSGTALITSDPVAFVQHRASRLAPRGPDGPPRGAPPSMPRPTPLPSAR